MEDQDRYWPQPIGSVNDSRPQAQRTATSLDQAVLDRSEWIKSRAKIVFGSYRRDDFADPENFLLQLGMVLERYDDKIIEAATSPLSGIQRECKFPPSIAEFVEFCNETQRRLNWATEYQKRTAEQLRARDRQDKEETLEHRTEAVKRAMSEYFSDVTRVHDGRLAIYAFFDYDFRANQPGKFRGGYRAANKEITIEFLPTAIFIGTCDG